MFEWLFRFVNICIRKLFFPRRSRNLINLDDTSIRKLTAHTGDDNKAAQAWLELETRAWIRDFWSRSFVAWIALLFSAVALTVSICTFRGAHHFDPGSPNSKDDAAQQKPGNLQQKTPNAN